MPHTIAFNHELDFIVLRAKGSMDVIELEKAFDELVGLPDFRRGLYLVVDFRGSETPLTTAELRRLAGYARQTDAMWRDTSWSFLASTDVTFGLRRMFMALTSEHQVETHVFRTLNDADVWFGLGVKMHIRFGRARPMPQRVRRPASDASSNGQALGTRSANATLYEPAQAIALPVTSPCYWAMSVADELDPLHNDRLEERFLAE